MHFEVEQKFPVADAAAFESRLVELGVTLGGPVTQLDQYFAHPNRDFARTDEALRIRRVGDKNFVTYKGPKIDSETKTRQEIELPLAGGDQGYDQFRQLLVALGFKPVLKVEKRRQTGHRQVDGFAAEITLDRVAGLGTFAEIELSADDATLDRARAALRRLADELALGDSERRSYLELLLSGA